MAYKQEQYGSLRCLTSIPAGQPTQERWPVLVFLHGIQEAAPAPIDIALAAHGPLQANSAPEATQCFVVVAPQLPQSGDWNRQAQAVREIAFEVARALQGNLRKMYLTGFSLGANGVLGMASNQQDVWAAVWPVDPTQAPAGMIERPIWVSAGQRSRGHKAALMGTLDLQELGSQGPTDRVYEDAGLGHVETAAPCIREQHDLQVATTS